MIVVADTSPLNYLILIDKVFIVERLYGRTLISHAVLDEMLSRKAPQPVRMWAQNLPNWVELLSPSKSAISSISELDCGETEAIALALEIAADWLLIDELDGRLEANKRGLRTIGTLGLLREAHYLELVDFRTCLALLQQAGFHVSQSLVEKILETL